MIVLIPLSYITPGNSFFFRGCGWPSSKPRRKWSATDIAWITAVNSLMEMLFGKEFLHYEYDKKRVCYVSCEDAPDYVYDHDHWEAELLNRLVETPCPPSSPSRRNATVNEPQDKKESKPARRCLFPSKKVVATPKLKKKSLKTLKSGQKSPSSSMMGQKLDPSSPHSPSSRNSTTNDA